MVRLVIFVGNIWNSLQLLLVIHIFPQDGDTSTTDLDGFVHLLAVKIWEKLRFLTKAQMEASQKIGTNRYNAKRRRQRPEDREGPVEPDPGLTPLFLATEGRGVIFANGQKANLIFVVDLQISS